MLTTRPRGTNDILPGEVERWHHLEEVLRRVASLYGYREIRTPIFEHTELFQRGVGETTDIVEKEMYTFADKGDRSLTLRPEATASTVRAFVEHKLYAGSQPTKLYYIGPMFRYDRPQAGRFRQFHQYGVEVIGSPDPGVDAEVISMAMDLYDRLGLTNLTVELNSVGCPVCRPRHREALRTFLAPSQEKMCKTCQGRLDRNPLRILDCKNETCRAALEGAPTITESLCPDCSRHFRQVQEYLTALGINFRLEPRLVRGLDYYTQTAFEIIAQGIGAQSSIGGGGRYDGLVEQCGGPALPGIGYALGLERILLTMEQQGIKTGTATPLDVFVAALGDEAKRRGAVLAQHLRKLGLATERDYLDRSLKAQLKTADRLQAKYTLILGEEELKNEQVILRRMGESSQTVVGLNDVTNYLLAEIEGER